MKKTLGAIAVLNVLIGCATPLHLRVDSEVKKGDSTEKVRAVLGNPDGFGPSDVVPNATVWTYQDSGAVCQVRFVGDSVDATRCDASNYVSTGAKWRRGLGTMLQGAGDGLKNASQQPIQPIQTQQPLHCTPDYGLNGGYTCR